MPKMKTHKGTKKRFRLSAKGKPKHRHSGTSHLATRKTHKQKRNLRGTAVVKTVEAQRIREALGATATTNGTGHSQRDGQTNGSKRSGLVPAERWKDFHENGER